MTICDRWICRRTIEDNACATRNGAQQDAEKRAHVDYADAGKRKLVFFGFCSLLPGLAGKIRRVLVFHRLQMLAVEHQLALVLEDLVAGANEPKVLVAGVFSMLVRIV